MFDCLRPAAPVTRPLDCPLFAERVAAGFPSPAEDYIERAPGLKKLQFRNCDDTLLCT